MKYKNTFEELKNYAIKMRIRGDSYKEIENFLSKQGLEIESRKNIMVEVEKIEKTTYVPIESMSFNEVRVKIRYFIIILLVLFILYLMFFVKNIRVIPLIFILLLMILSLQDQNSKSFKS